MDSFCEHLVKRKKRTSEKISCVVLIIIALIFTVFAVLWLWPLVLSLFRDAATLVFPLIVAVWWGVLILIKRYNIEYEYALTGSDIDVDKIINQKKRQRIISSSLRTMAIVAPLSSAHYTDEYKNMITLDCSCGDSETAFFAVYNADGQQKCMIFTPSEKMLEHMKLYCREKFHLS